MLFLIFPEFWIAFYTHNEQVSSMAVYLLMIAGLFQLSDGVQCVAVGILRGLSDTRIPTLITVIAYWVVGIPFGLWLSHTFQLSLYGIWFGLSIGLTFSAILLTLRFVKQSSRISI
ncbi:MAG: MATE family efflux transporter, partial [Bacteroidota bacterium]